MHFRYSKSSTSTFLMLDSIVPSLRALFLGQKFLVLFILISLQLSSVLSYERRCAACGNFTAYAQMKKEQILSELLRKLELTSVPSVTIDYDNLPPIGRQNPKIKQLIELSKNDKKRRLKRGSNFHEMEEKAHDYYPELYETDTEAIPQTTFLPAQKPKPEDDVGVTTAYFDFSPSISRKTMIRAHLHVPIRRPTVSQQFAFTPISIRINIYERFYNGSIGDTIQTEHVHVKANGDFGDDTETKVDTFKVTLNELDVERWVQDRLAGTRTWLGVYVEANFDDENLVMYPGNGENSMFLEIDMVDGSIRNKRSSETCNAKNNDTKCCLHDLEIDFEAAGWNFVIAPKKYNAYVCNGECSPSQGGHRAQMAHSAKVDYYQCCHPKEYTGLTIVYMTADSNQIWIKEVPGMIARKCGCA